MQNCIFEPKGDNGIKLSEKQWEEMSFDKR